MQVFKLCMKILRKNIPFMMIYVVVFLNVSLIMTSAGVKDQEKISSFEQFKSDVAFISEEETPLIDGFKEELGKVANYVELPDETEALQDALYFRKVSYILRVPKGFTGKFMNGEDVQLEKTIVPGSYTSTYLDMTIDQYFNTARLYLNQEKDISQEDLVSHLKSDLSAAANVELQTASLKSANHIYANYYFNYLSYSLLCVLILGMSALMMVFNNHDLKRRTACSPLIPTAENLQFILASLLFTFIAWFVMVLFCFMFNLKNSFNLNSIYFILNTFVFAICGASISYLIGNVVTNEKAVPAVSNVVTLGLSFISGVFVPQELLGASVLKLASFTPTYWFVRSNNLIAALTQFDFPHIQPILSGMTVLFGFALAFFAVALVIGKKRRFQ